MRPTAPCKHTLLFLCCIFTFMAHGQLLTVPAKKAEPKPDPPKAQASPKPKVKKVVAKLKEEDDDNDNEPKKEGEGRFAALQFKANRGSAMSVFVNDTLIGKVKAGSSRRIYVDKEDLLEIKMDDGFGNAKDTTVYVDESLQGQLISVAFPEVDYDGPKREAIRLKRVADSTAAADRRLLAEAERAAKLEEARLAKELADAERAAKVEAIRQQKEQEERLRQERLAALKVQFTDALTTSLAGYGSSGQSLTTAVEAFRNGNLTIDEAKALQTQYEEARSAYLAQRKIYFDSLDAGGFADEKKQYLAANIEAEKAAAADAPQALLRKAAAGEIATSKNLEVALRNNRSTDLKFFIPADSINRPFLGGKTPVEKAIEFNADSNTMRFLVSAGAEVTNFGARVESNPEVYNTLLSRTVANGNPGAVTVLAKAGAQFFPSSLPRKQRKLNAAYVNGLAAQHAGMPELLKQLGFDLDDGTAALQAAAADIAASMVAVQAGSFRMGCPPNDQTCAGDEKGGNKVFVDAYSIGAKEVTQQQWFAVMDEALPSAHKGCMDCPVENVSWEEVQKFIEALNKATGKSYRLPYESEWEYAAHGGHLIDTNLYKLPPYPGKAALDSLCWYKLNSGLQTHSVATKTPNVLGLYDMGGNVAEWCQDWYDENYYRVGVLNNPKGPEAGLGRVYRGGSCTNSDFAARITNRDGFTGPSKDLGFRLVLPGN